MKKFLKKFHQRVDKAKILSVFECPLNLGTVKKLLLWKFEMLPYSASITFTSTTQWNMQLFEVGHLILYSPVNLDEPFDLRSCFGYLKFVVFWHTSIFDRESTVAVLGITLMIMIENFANKVANCLQSDWSDFN